MAGKGGVIASIISTFDDAGVKKAQHELANMSKSASTTGGAMGVLKGAVLAAGAAMAAAFAGHEIISFFEDSAKAAMHEELLIRSLGVTLNNLGLASQNAISQEFIDNLARTSGVAKNELYPAFRQLVTATGDVQVAQKALQLAMDVSAGSTKELSQVSTALTRAYSGSTTGLSRLGTGISSAILKTKDMTLITAALNEKFAGQAAEAADTYTGKLNRVGVAAEEAKVKIGFELLKAIDKVSEAFGGVGGLNSVIDQASQAMADFITGTSAGVSPIVDFLSGMKQGTKSTFDFTDALKLAYLPFAPLITATENLVDAGAALRITEVKQERATTKLRDEYITATGAIVGFVAAEFAADDTVVETTNAIVTQFAAMSRINQAMQDAGSRAIFVASADDTLRLAAADAASAVSSLGGSSGGAAKATDTLTKAQERVAQKIEDARTKTDAAIKTFTDYRDSVAGSLNGMLDLGAAFESFTERQTNLATAQKALTDFQTSIVGEATDSQIQDLAKLQAAYHDASAAAAKGSQSVVEEFEAQGRKLAEFGQNLSTLLSANLSKRAFDAIRGMSADRGAEVAAALVGGLIHENVARINSVYDSINTMAIGVGNQGVTAFEQVGLTMASAMIEAMLVVVNGKGRARLKAMLDDLNNAMNVAAAGGPMPAAPVGGSSRAPAVPFVDASGVTRLLTPRSHGGPVSAGRSYMVGEAGPELFTPSRSGNITPNSAMGGNTYNINVTAGVGDPRAIGQQVVEYIKKFEKANGPVFTAA